MESPSRISSGGLRSVKPSNWMVWIDPLEGRPPLGYCISFACIFPVWRSNGHGF